MERSIKPIGFKVAVDSGPISAGDSAYGMGTYVRELLSALKLDIRNSKFKIEQVDASKVTLSKYDLVHLTKFRPFFISFPFSKPSGTKFVLTIYDLIPLIYPKHYPPGIKGYLSWQINKYLIRKNVDAIITISETSKKDICRFLSISPNKVYVTYLAPPPIYRPILDRTSLVSIKKKYNLPERFALSDTEIYYSKNIPNLIKACKIANVPLVIVGKNAKRIRSVDQRELNHPELVHLKNIDWKGVYTLGSVPIEDLVKVYNLATVYIQSSFYEGFGLPLTQSVACKIPVVVAKTQCPVELLGNDIEYVDANDPKSIANGILNPNKNVKFPRDYRWEKTAEKTLEVYKNV